MKKTPYNLPPHLAFLGKFITPFELIATKAILARVILWFLFFMVIAHFLAPRVTPQMLFTDILEDKNIISLSSERSDLRYTDTRATLNDDAIIWIAGSSVDIRSDQVGAQKQTLLTEQVADNLPDDLTHYLLIKQSRRILDTHAMVLEAIKKRPNAMVITLNPFWVLKEHSLFSKGNLMNRGASLWPQSGRMDMALALTSPGNALWAALGQHHNLFYYGYDYLQYANNYLKENILSKNGLKPNEAKKKNTRAQTPEKLKQKLYKNSLVFWMDEKFGPPLDYIAPDMRNQAQMRMMQDNAPKDARLAKMLFEDILNKTKQSGIPTLFYVPPVSKTIDNTPAKDAHLSVIAALEGYKTQYQSGNMHFILNIPDDVYDTLVYRDYLHLSDSGVMPQYLADNIQSMMIKQAK